MKIQNILLLIFCSFALGLIICPKIFPPKKQESSESNTTNTSGEIMQIEDTYIKPTVLFHGSPNKEIKIFEKREKKTSKKFPDGPLVFATTSLPFAACFMIEWNDSWCHQCSFDSGPVIIVCKDKERFLKADKGGAIYVLPSQGFYTRLYGGPATEWANKNEVKPLEKLKFESAYKEMLDMGVQIFFVDEKLFEEITKSKNKIEILMKLELEGKSTNKEQNINPMPLFDYAEWEEE